MKGKLIQFVAIICCILPLAVINHARTVLKFEVPFDFVVRNKVFPAGNYTLRSNDPQNRLWIIAEKSIKNPAASLVASSIEGVDQGSSPKLRFRVYGNRYFLAALTTPDYRIIMPRTKQERLLNDSSANSQAFSEIEIISTPVAGQYSALLHD